jgi:hypothetical protein
MNSWLRSNLMIASMMKILSPEVFLFANFSALAHPTQKEKFINRKTTGEPARKITAGVQSNASFALPI